MRRASSTALILLVATGAVTATAAAPPLKVGSKRFTESYLLAEMAVALTGAAEGRGPGSAQALGGTAIAYRALEEGSIDLYPEYTGTVSEAVLQSAAPLDLNALRARLASRGIGISEPLGFDNTYALAVPAATAARLGLRRISDLARHPELRLGFSHEFFGRPDGWPGVLGHYGLTSLGNVRALDHGLAYAAVGQGALDVTDAYSTDAQLRRYDLRILQDDRGFFPSYQAVYLYRLEALRQHPEAFARLRVLNGALSAEAMTRLNGQVELEGKSFPEVARGFLFDRGWLRQGTSSRAGERRTLFRGVQEATVRHGPRHLVLVLVSLALAIAVGIPLGVLAARQRTLGQGVLGATGLIQTLPSLALLCFFIPVLGTGVVPALAALFLYGLLPIVRNTYVGLRQIPRELVESARALGLPPWIQLTRVYLPLASPTMFAGVKTSAVIGVGTATLAAFIGAGGFGEPISVGLNLNDTSVILTGAIPAAGLALVVQGAFEVIERILVPKGLRLPRQEKQAGSQR